MIFFWAKALLKFCPVPLTKIKGYFSCQKYATATYKRLLIRDY